MNVDHLSPSLNKSHQVSRYFDLNRLLRPREQKLDILLMSNKYNSLSQRVSLELQERGHTLHIVEPEDSDQMVSAVRIFQPDLVLCPFLTKRIPEELWANNRLLPFLVVHPGIEGDRGMHSLDWALKQGQTEWGVTVLEAADEMDAGDIWATKTFPIFRHNKSSLTKSSLYSNEVTEAAVDASIEAVNSFLLKVAPRPLDYADSMVKGSLQQKMTKRLRGLEWEATAEEVAQHIRMSDSNPGAVGHFRLGSEWTREFRIFGAHIEGSDVAVANNTTTKPGTILGHRHDGILVKCGEGSVWVSHLKAQKLKLPSAYYLQTETKLPLPRLASPDIELPHGTVPDTFQEIWATVNHGVCYVHFNFYNGAMNVNQCRRLQKVLQQLKSDNRFSVVVLMGGHNFFSNGIHLNVIEQAQDPAKESWENINAINDVVKEIFTMTNKVTIAALQGNAGAGGVMMALASDVVWARDGVVLNPHYRTMHLHGSEYHTHFLTQRVGADIAEQLTSQAKPILATQAKEIGLVTDTLGRHQADFVNNVQARATQLSRRPILGDILRDKFLERSQPGWLAQLENCRQHELDIMQRNFVDSAYHEARKKFVYH